MNLTDVKRKVSSYRWSKKVVETWLITWKNRDTSYTENTVQTGFLSEMSNHQDCR